MLMKLRKPAALLLVLIIAAVMFSSCGVQQSQGPSTVTDIIGREISVPKEVKTIVSLTPSNTEIIYSLGLGDKLVGRDDFSTYPEQAKDIPVMGDYNGPNVEAVIAAKADVVFAGNHLQQETIDSLQNAGCTVVCSEATAYDEIYKSIELIAAVCGAKPEALISDIKDRINAAKPDGERTKPAVYYVMSYGEFGNWTGGNGSFINSAIELAGGECVTKDVDVQWVEYSLETLVEKDPDIILLSSMYTVDQLSAAAGYSDLTAVKEGRVFVIDVETVERPGPRIADAVEAIAKIITQAQAG